MNKLISGDDSADDEEADKFHIYRDVGGYEVVECWCFFSEWDL